MPTEVKVIHATDFIKATPQGEFDFERSRSMLLQIASAARSMHDYVIILDTRKAESKLSAINIWYLAGELQKLGDTFLRKTAILCPLNRFDKAKFFALCAESKGFEVRAFTGFEDAMEWLNSSDQPEKVPPDILHD